MSTTKKATVHGPNYIEFLDVSRNTNLEELQNLFDISEKSVLSHKEEILSLKTIEWTSFLMIKWSSGRTQEYTSTQIPSCDWRRCLIIQKRIKDGKVIEEFRQSSSCRELFGVDGEPIEFEWNIFPRFSTLGLTSLEILQKIQQDLQDRNIKPEDVEDRIIFMSMFNDID